MEIFYIFNVNITFLNLYVQAIFLRGKYLSAQIADFGHKATGFFGWKHLTPARSEIFPSEKSGRFVAKIGALSRKIFSLKKIARTYKFKKVL